MKKLGLVLMFGLVLLSLVLASAEMTKSITSEKDGKQTTKTITRSCDKTENGKECTKTITIEKTNKNNETIIRTNTVSAKTEWDIEVDKENNKTYVNFTGYRKEVKIMPDTASERALERLRLKVCNESNNCTIQLKDVGNNQTELSYELQVERHYKLLGMFKKKAEVRAQIGAESGNVTVTKGPWWAFLATQQDN